MYNGEHLLLTGTEDSSFSESLQKLKQRGCSVLVCGLVPSDDINRLSVRLLSGPDSQMTRTQLFGLIDRDISSVHSRLGLIDADGEATRVIDMQILTRSTDTRASTDGVSPLNIAAVPSDIDEFETEIRQEMVTSDRSVEETGSSELRVCIDSLSPFLTEYDTTRVEAFLDALDQMAISTGSIVHTILPVRHDSSIVDRLTPFFDIVIALRSTTKDTIQQQWYVLLSDHRTDWIRPEAIRLHNF